MLTRLSRAEITTPPINGAKIVSKILGDERLKMQWLDDLLHMSERMRLMRRALVEGLRRRHTPGSWNHVISDVSLSSGPLLASLELIDGLQIGMFSMTGLTPKQIQQLREEHHVYLLPSGRISVTGCESEKT
jgi:aspartate aminotransferase